SSRASRPTNRGVRNGHAVGGAHRLPMKVCSLFWRRRRISFRLTYNVEGKPMKSFRKELWFETPGRRAFLNITPQVEVALKESDVKEEIALINAIHIPASFFINDDEQGLRADYEVWLKRLAPNEPVAGYRHNRIGEDNADAHMKRQIMGRE